MSKIITKLTGEDIITEATFSSGTYSAANKAAIESVGDDDAFPSTLVKRTAQSCIVCAEFDSANIVMDATTLSFYGGVPVTQPAVIDAPVLDAGNDVEAAVDELQYKLSEVLVALKDLGLIAKT